MCGICGIIYTRGSEEVIEDKLSKGLQALRHRGYDGSGLCINIPCKTQLMRRRIVDTGDFIKHFNRFTPTSGSVNKNTRGMRISGIAHTRYKTAGACTIKNTQPVMNKDNTISLVHNGQIEVYKASESGNTSDSTEHIFDSKYILEVFCNSFEQTDSIFRSVKAVHDTVKGSYACIIMIKDLGIVAFRDPRGIRPLVFGVEKSNNDLSLFDDIKNVEYAAFASESIIFDEMDIKLVRNVKPGESIFVDLKGNVRYGSYCVSNPPQGFVLCGEEHRIRPYTPCMFEYIYLADERSSIDGINVGKARRIMGELLYDNLNRYFGTIDVVAPVPNTPVDATKRIAELLNVKYVDLLYLPTLKQLENSMKTEQYKNALKTSRTFILPTQNKRELAVKEKFRIDVNHISECQDKTIALVDDSIVRGTTMKIIVNMIRDLVQPKKIILVSLCPPVRYENVYGIDIPDRKTLVAHNRSLSQIAKELGADEVVYGNLESIVDAFKKEAAKNGVYVDGYETSVFNNE